MDIRDLLFGRQNQPLFPQITLPQPETWPGPQPATNTPQIPQQKFRRYFQQGAVVTCPALATVTLIETIFDYPSIIQEINLIIDGDGEPAIDQIKVDIDDATILDAKVQDLQVFCNNASLYNNSKTISDNLLASATLESGYDYLQSGNPYPAFFTAIYLNESDIAGLHINGGWLVNLKLETYCVRKINVTYQNVDALEDASIVPTMTTDRPIESKYSSSYGSSVSTPTGYLGR
jgi:hypothetical protein